MAENKDYTRICNPITTAAAGLIALIYGAGSTMPSAMGAEARQTAGIETKVNNAPSTQSARPQEKAKLIVLDPGHGMGNRNKGVYDPGAISEGYQEADIALAQAKIIKKKLEKLGYRVALTREDAKKDTPLNSRNKFAGETPDLLVSLHCNAYTSQTARGIEVFYNEHGREAAEKVNERLLSETNGVRRKVEQRNLAVLNGKIPSILVESGFLTNPEDRVYLTDNKPDVEDGIVKGIDSYLSPRS